MATETLTTGPVNRINGTEIYERAKEQVAARRGTLAEVQEEIDGMIRDVVEGRTKVELPEVQGFQQEEMPIDLPEDQIPEMFRQGKEGDVEAMAEEAKAEAKKLHQEDIAEADGRSDIHITKEPAGVLGHSDGDEAYVDLHNGLNSDTIRHEEQHVKDGDFMHAAEDLDVGIAKDVTNDLPDELAVHIEEDDEALDLSARAVLEKRATVAGGSAPEQYKRDFVNPYDNVAQRLDDAGLEGKATLERLVESKDVAGYQKAVRQMLAYEALQKVSVN